MLPVRVILPRETLSPLDDSDGTSPTKDMNDRASGKREKSPISAAMEKALTVDRHRVVGLPRADRAVDKEPVGPRHGLSGRGLVSALPACVSPSLIWCHLPSSDGA